MIHELMIVRLMPRIRLLNDLVLAFGTSETQILIEPIFFQWIHSTHAKTSYGFDVLLSSTKSPALNVGRPFTSIFVFYFHF